MLQDDLSTMVDNSMASDVTVHVSGDEPSVHAHSFILAARAPQMYKVSPDMCRIGGGREGMLFVWVWGEVF